MLRTTTPTVARALARALAATADHCFGLMGNGNAHLIDALLGEGVAYTAVRHEAGTVAAADAYTRVSGHISIATTTYGAGFTNALTALAEAEQARTPLLLVVGDVPTTGGRPWDIDQDRIAAGLGVSTFRVAADTAAETVAEAVAEAERSRRPVVIGIPYDLPAAAVAEPRSAAENRRDRAGDPSVADGGVAEDGVDFGGGDATEITAAAARLAAAERPLILAGHGAALASPAIGDDLDELAALLGAPTATTALARGIFPRRDYDLGVTGGFGSDAAMQVVADADTVLVVGAGLNQFTMRFGELFGAGATVIRIDVDAVAAPRTVHDINVRTLRGDAADTVRALTAAVRESARPSSGWRERLADAVPFAVRRAPADGFAEHADGVCPDGRLDPRCVAARIGAMLPDDAHITTDGGHFLGWASMYWPVPSPERLIMVGTAYQTIGLGFPTVAGVAAAKPDTTVVLSTGDGGGLMALADLETAIRTAESGVIVVWNDGAYGAEVHLYGKMGLDDGPMLIPDTDFAGVATALGATGVRVTSLADLDALTRWTAAGARGTILLDCRISRSVVAPYQREIQRVNGVG
ncbi:thiamine pyrophosphate-binding protein [Leucobacter tardus]|uniref:Thiamine pyrophosphate-binding protein n=1 Tax=Leucobacter tardus TaxID=501483 RepID=A0A939QGE3_9MICO|nr:thiamine pyrophosphate-binding protein [Leucobacter tardus]MBO2988414.1 thiamine pyrophosphate-binding protein [Leucobacter tardus]